MRGTCTIKGITILYVETFVCHCFRNIAAHTLILYNVSSLTDNFISLHVSWDWTSCANSFLMARGYRCEWGNMKRKDRVIKYLGTWMWQQNMWVVLCVINRDITNAYGGHMRRYKWTDLYVKCRSAVTAHITHTHIPHVHFLAYSKRFGPKCLVFIFLKRRETTPSEPLWSCVLTPVGLEMFDLPSSLNRVLIPTV